jgi:predicted O-methyltransferase YrrM
MFIVNSPQERLQLAHKNLKQCLLENYQAQSPLSSDNTALAAQSLPDDLQPESFLKEVYKSGMFTADWFSHNIPHLYKGLQKSGQTFNRYLETGSFEGLSTCWFARLLSRTSSEPSITAIDNFGNNVQHGDVDKRFDSNTKFFMQGISVIKIKSDSANALSKLFKDKEEYDLIYVGGAHDALSVIVNASLCWRMLRNDGVIIFNDYFWFKDKDSRDVLYAVNAFLDLIEGQYKVLNVFHQVIIQKIIL